MRIYFGQRFVTILYNLLLLQETLAALSITTNSFNRILQDAGMTILGPYNVYNTGTKVGCAGGCSSFGCTAWAWDAGLKECRIFSNIFTYVVPVAAPKTVSTYLKTNTQVIYITLISKPNSFSWNNAKSFCEDEGETLIYIPENDEAIRLLDQYGNFYAGLYKPEGPAGPIEDLFGNQVLETDIVWDENQPEHMYFMDCITRWGRNGHHDMFCDSANDWDPKTAFCTFSK